MSSALPAAPLAAGSSSTVALNPAASRVHLAVVFSGPTRVDGIPQALEQISRDAKCSCFDLVLSPDHDFLNDAHWNAFLTRLRALEFTAIHLAPPCNTWSRARRGEGPPPLRADSGPEMFGLKSLSPALLQRCKEGTLLALRAAEAMMLCIERRIPFTLKTPFLFGDGPHITKLPEYRKVLAMNGVITKRLDQCRYGAKTAKPTLFIMYRVLENMMVNGLVCSAPVNAEDVVCNHQPRSWTVPWSGQTRVLPHPWSSSPPICRLLLGILVTTALVYIRLFQR